MSESIGLVASAASTLYYGGFRPNNGNLRKEHFIWLCTAADSKIKQDEYDQQVRDAMRMRVPNPVIVLSDDNYMTVTVDVKDNKAKLPFPIMSFTGDNGTVGILSVKPVSGCKQFMRIRPNEDWMVCDIKDVVFWKQKDNCNIEFINLKEICNSKQVDVRYIGQLNGKGQVQESRKFKILNLVMSFIKAAKDGNVIDMSNDGNPNGAQQTEINKLLLKAVQGR